MTDACYVRCRCADETGPDQVQFVLVERGGEEIQCSLSTLRRMKTLHDMYQTVLTQDSGSTVRIPVPVDKRDLCLLLEQLMDYAEEFQPASMDSFADLVSVFRVRGLAVSVVAAVVHRVSHRVKHD